MRVLSILSTCPPAFSGATKSWMRLAPGFKSHGIELETLHCYPDGKLVLERADGSLEPVTYPAGIAKGSHLGLVLAIVKVIWTERRRYGCVFFLGAPDALYAALLLRPLMQTRIAYRMTMLGEDDPLAVAKTGRLGRLRIRLLRRIDAAICINPAMETRSLEAGIERRRIFTVLQGTDIEHFRPPEPDSRHAIRLREQIPEDAKVVIFCGAITERKGVDLLLRAWPSVLAAESKALLLLVGPNGGQSDDPGDHFLNAMRRLAALPANGTSVRFLGYREDVRALMQSADAFVLPSRMEGTPNALLEAMATGLPIVIAELPGISGVFVRAGVDAVVVPQNDAVGISESLKKLLGDTRMAKHFGEKARERAVLEFSHLNIVKRFADAFRGAT